MTEQPDTVTPLDGDGSNVTGIEAQHASENVKAEDYETRGQTTVATRRGYAYVPSDKSLPMITSAGVKMTKSAADALVAESDENDGGVFVVEEGE